MVLKHFEVLGGKMHFAVVSGLITVETQSSGLETLGLHTEILPV